MSEATSRETRDYGAVEATPVRSRRHRLARLATYPAAAAAVVAVVVLVALALKQPQEQVAADPSQVTAVTSAPGIPDQPVGPGQLLYRSCTECPWILLGKDGRQWALPTPKPNPEHTQYPSGAAVSLSPDGGRLVYSPEHEDGVVYDLVRGGHHALPRTVGVIGAGAAWAADGHLLVLNRGNETPGGEAVVIDISSLRVVTRVPRAAADRATGIDPAGRLITFRPTFKQNPDGVISGDEPPSQRALILVSDSHGNVVERAVTDPARILKPGEGIARAGYLAGAAASPDGKLLAVEIWDAQHRAAGIALVDTGTGRIQRRLGAGSQSVQPYTGLCRYVPDAVLVMNRGTDNRGVFAFAADSGRVTSHTTFTREVADISC